MIRYKISIITVISSPPHHNHFHTVFDVDQSHKPSPQVSATDRWTHSRDDAAHCITIWSKFSHLWKSLFTLHMFLSHTWSPRRHIIHVCLLSEKQLLLPQNICVPGIGNPVTSFLYIKRLHPSELGFFFQTFLLSCYLSLPKYGFA